MAAADQNTSGISADSLQASLTTRLEATHVEVEDMSGKAHLVFHRGLVRNNEVPMLTFCVLLKRWMWSSIPGHHRIAAVRQEDSTGETSTGQFRPQR